MLFDGVRSDTPEANPYFAEMESVVTADHTMEFVRELFGPNHPMMYDMVCGRPWAIIEPIHNIVVSVIMVDDEFEIGFHRRQADSLPAPISEAQSETR